MEDLHCGWIGEFIDIDEFDMAARLLCHRFGVWEARDGGW